MTASRPGIVWYRDDLRVSDHPALHAASKEHASVACVYTLDDRAPGIRPLGGAARWWLAQSLRALQADLRERGASLVLRRGSAPKVIAALARETGAGSVYWNEIAQSPQQAVADRVAAALGEIDVAAQRFPGDLLAAPSQIRNKENRGLRVFTPFWRRVQALGDPPKPLPAPKQLNGVPDLASDALENWELEPARPDWAGGLRETWQPGEASAQARLQAFLAGGIAG
jgi:deoxyribodipyrimidine photo-lyase